ncbi:uncharacterized protein [Panulirus ornatus]|uniref:uncharacterized protein n=1 Tax=Panulirus ornatus TaxID=150431 RepID=UPI003A83E601
MRQVLDLLLLSSWVVVAQAGLLDVLRVDPADHQVQHDQPQTKQPSENDVQNLIEALSRNFMELRQNQSDSWYSRYDTLAKQNANNSAVVTRLLQISRVAVPIIWNAYMGNSYLETQQNVANGGLVVYSPSGGAAAPHPLQEVRTDLLARDDFTVEVEMKLREEASVGLRLMYVREDQAFNWEEDDILVSVLLRWHFEHGNSRELVMNNKYDGVWGPNEVIAGGKKWPSLVVGEKFVLVLKKNRECFYLHVKTGAERYQIQLSYFHFHVFCPTLQPTEAVRKEQSQQRLMVVVDEQHVRSGELEVHSIKWYPTSH